MRKCLCQRWGHGRRTRGGFTLVEVIFVAAILAVVILGLIRGYLYIAAAGDMAEKKMTALIAADALIEEMREADFDTLISTYNGRTFPLDGVEGLGTVRVVNTHVAASGAVEELINGEPLEVLAVRVAVCWRNHNGRVVGEDQNLDGALDGEDINGNLLIDSPVTIETVLARR